MIEALVQYIKDKGFLVDVYPGELVISKKVGEQKISMNWAISQLDIQYLYAAKEILFQEADDRMRTVDEAIQKSIEQA